MVYLDNAASTPLAPEVKEEMWDVMNRVWGNPSSVHFQGKASRSLIENARARIAALLECDADELVFTSGATEAINTVLKGAVRNLGIRRIISSQLEHSASRKTLKTLAENGDAKIEYVKTTLEGAPDFNHLEELLSGSTEKTLVCLMHGNNETGRLLNIEEAGNLIHRHNALFFSDTVQSLAYVPLSISQLPVDFIACSAHKLHGPKGAGFFFARKGLSPFPLIEGGGQEKGLRSGTENLYGIAGMAKAFTLAVDARVQTATHLNHLKSILCKGINSIVPGAVFFAGSDKGGLPHIVSVGLPRTSTNELLHIKLDMKGICISTGSACSSGNVSIPHTLNEMGIGEEYLPLRISTSRYTTEEEVEYFLKALQEAIQA